MREGTYCKWCEKPTWTTVAVAERMARSKARTFGHPLYVYRCPYRKTKKYHLTTSPQ